MKTGLRNAILTIVWLVFIIFITILSRMQTLNRVIHLQPFWSYSMIFRGEMKYATQIVLNIILFVPFGFFLSICLRPWWVIPISAFTSAAVELIQFATYRGMLDVDDLISNVIGAGLGILLWLFMFRHKSGKMVIIVSSGMMIAGLLGCFVAVGWNDESTIELRTMKQFEFKIDSTTITEDNIIISGKCYAYDRHELPFNLLVSGTEAETFIEGENFFATVPVPEGKADIQVRFYGYSPMPTGVWVNKNAKIEYTLENAIIPSGVPESAVLKAYVPAYDTYVFENMGSILWLIGWDKLDKNTEIIYHLHTNEQNELPEHRIQYGFDNKGFNTETGSRIVLGTEEDSIRNYQVFEKEIPTGYNVTVILVGFNTEGTVTWNRSFRPL